MAAGEQSRKSVRVVSAVLEDGTMLETIRAGEGQPTQLVIALDGKERLASDFTHGGIRYVPVVASHNLIQHGAVKLPGVPTPYVSRAKLFDEIVAYAHRYVALSPEFMRIVATYVLLSWVYDAFKELPYLRFRGDYGSGKTRALMVFGSICYKGFFASGASTVSPIFHTLDAFGGTLIFDEADFRFTDEKAELVKILNNGNVRGFSVLRTTVSARKDFEPRAFSVYGPKIVAMRSSYEDRALESRFITEEMSGRTMHADIPISLPDSQESEARTLRSKLLMYRLRERATVGINPDLRLADVEARMNQILLPLLSVAPTEEAREAIRAYGARMQHGVMSDRANSTEGQLLAVIAKLCGEGRESLSLKEIVAALSEQFGGDYERPITNRFVGGVLRNRLGLQLYKTNGIIALSLADRSRLDVLFSRFGAVDNGIPAEGNR